MDHAFISSDACATAWAAPTSALPATVRAALQPVADLAAAEAYTRQLAHSHYENFSVISILLPRHLRQDFCNVYAFCRSADDAADEIPDRDQSLRLLAEIRQELHATYAGRPNRPIFIALS